MNTGGESSIFFYYFSLNITETGQVCRPAEQATSSSSTATSEIKNPHFFHDLRCWISGFAPQGIKALPSSRQSQTPATPASSTPSPLVDITS